MSTQNISTTIKAQLIEGTPGTNGKPFVKIGSTILSVDEVMEAYQVALSAKLSQMVQESKNGAARIGKCDKECQTCKSVKMATVANGSITRA